MTTSLNNMRLENFGLLVATDRCYRMPDFFGDRMRVEWILSFSQLPILPNMKGVLIPPGQPRH